MRRKGWRATACSSRSSRTTNGRPLTKSFSASADGRTIDEWEAARNSSSARAIRAGLDPDPTRTFTSLQAKVRSLKQNQCLITAPLPGTAPTRQVVFKEQWERCRRLNAIWRVTARSIGGPRASPDPRASRRLGNGRGHQGLA